MLVVAAIGRHLLVSHRLCASWLDGMGSVLSPTSSLLLHLRFVFGRWKNPTQLRRIGLSMFLGKPWTFLAVAVCGTADAWEAVLDVVAVAKSHGAALSKVQIDRCRIARCCFVEGIAL